jgi:hypothetical protein
VQKQSVSMQREQKKCREMQFMLLLKLKRPLYGATVMFLLFYHKHCPEQLNKHVTHTCASLSAGNQNGSDTQVK